MTNISFIYDNPTQVTADLLIAYVSEAGIFGVNDTAIAQAASDLKVETSAGTRTLLPSCGSAARQIALIGTELSEMAKRRSTSFDDGLELAGTGRHRHYAAIGVRGAKAKKVVLAGNYQTFDEVVAAGVGAILGNYEFKKYGNSEVNSLAELVILAPADLDEDLAQLRISVLAESMIQVMDLVNRAPNDLYPETFANYAKEEAEKLGITAEVWDFDRLVAENCGGIVAVGQGSTHKPYLVKLSYTPENAENQISFVGKGITFDSGGLSLKPSDSMETMKCDMAGAATVLAATLAAAKLGLSVGVSTYLALAENLPSSTAQRPSDVLLMRNGLSVETTNTDAEGRLVMADALALAAETDTDAIVDVATLTGAQMVGLGVRTAGVMGTEEVRDVLVASANEVGEAMWPAPLPSYLRETLRSPVADLKNSGIRWGGMLTAGIFLQEFVADKPWAHVDIAGPAYNDGSAWGANASGATGMGVLTLVEWLETLV
ncbi:leucyl aminopeptidase [Gleimia sp. 6138-11-ORH1]|uniref:leucyl aminopeptidase n=1 Tax=Gleimia sp. 6138-11-ORH1 TaxID=2973937 RepID=UPI002167E08F|nr:leucyl aminopeptidase [Gleimia sp. 6138-11-ORH1]MCS4484267.1 leucyl aminopeptidase [Gleimia sp. 6138-11-ORH1]